MSMEEGQPRVNHRRVDQAIETEATRVATACPFCLTMFDEGIACRGAQDRVAVDDIAVYVARSMRRPGGGDPSAAPTPAPG
jgi:Fe-S oxidoreductase